MNGRVVSRNSGLTRRSDAGRPIFFARGTREKKLQTVLCLRVGAKVNLGTVRALAHTRALEQLISQRTDGKGQSHAAGQAGKAKGNLGSGHGGPGLDGQGTCTAAEGEGVNSRGRRNTAVRAVDPGAGRRRVGERRAAGELPAAAGQNAGVRGELGQGDTRVRQGREHDSSQDEEAFHGFT